MKVRFSPRASSDLWEIGEFIAVDNPKRAASFVSKIEARAASSAKYPKAHPYGQIYRFGFAQLCSADT